MLTAALDETTVDFGRVVRDEKGRLDRVVERSDATDEELAIDEVNTSIYCFRRGLLAPALRRLSPENAQGEYYLTDVLEVLRQAGHTVVAVPADDPTAALHVNNRAQLAAAEAVLRERINDRWMREGVGMVDPARTYVDTSVELEPDVRLLPGTILEGRTVIGAGSVVGPDSRLVDTVVGERCELRQVVATEAELGNDVTVGPVRAPATGDAHRRRRPRRRLRRDEERRDRGGGEGSPPRVRRRRRDRRPGQHRRGHDHRQLRRHPQAPHEGRGRRPDRVEHRARRARRGRRGRLHRRRRGREPRRAARRAGQGRAGHERRGLGGPPTGRAPATTPPDDGQEADNPEA